MGCAHTRRCEGHRVWARVLLGHGHVVNGEVSELVVASRATSPSGLGHAEVDFDRIVRECSRKRYRYPAPKISHVHVSAGKNWRPRARTRRGVRANQYLKVAQRGSVLVAKEYEFGSRQPDRRDRWRDQIGHGVAGSATCLNIEVATQAIRVVRDWTRCPTRGTGVCGTNCPAPCKG